MSRMKPNDEGINYMPGEITTPDEGYKELACCIVAQAADDYVSYILRPDLEDEVAALKPPMVEATALSNVVRKIGGYADDPGYIEAAKKLALEIAEKSRRDYPQFARKLKGIIEQLSEAETYEELKAAVLRYKKHWYDTHYGAKERNQTRKNMGFECEAFFRSDMFQLFCGGTIDPDRLIEQCRKEAAKIRKERGLGESDRLDRFTQ